MTTQLIGSALDRVLHSKTFSRSRSLQDFLTFIVTHSLEPDQNLKEYRIGADALKRGGAFDPSENSIVRVQAYRLRAKLADYYQHEGQTEDVRIDLEPGSYTPVIRDCAVVTSFRSLRYAGIVLDILPLDSLAVDSFSPAAGPNDAAAYVYTVLSSHVDQLLRVTFARRPVQPRSAKLRLQLELRARATEQGLRIIAYLTNADSKRVVYSHGMYLHDMTKSPGLAVSDLEKAGVDIAQAVWKRIESNLSSNG